MIKGFILLVIKATKRAQTALSPVWRCLLVVARRVKSMTDKAAWLTAIGAMCIPIALVLALDERVNTSFIGIIAAITFGIIGVVCLGKGLSKINDEERSRKKEAEENNKRRQVETQRRQEEHIEYLTTLRVIAKQLGANSVLTRRKTEREVERFREQSEVEDDDL